MKINETFAKAWAFGILIAIGKTITVIAVVALAMSGGAYSHAEELGHQHADEAHHSHDHSHSQEKCCDSGVSETVHCGANLLTLVEFYQLNHPAQVLVLTPVNVQELFGVSTIIDPPPPRRSLV